MCSYDNDNVIMTAQFVWHNYFTTVYIYVAFWKMDKNVAQIGMVQWSWENSAIHCTF